MYTVQNDLAYLNHIIGTHYNTSFVCGTCLSAVTSLGQQMKRHINECSGLAPPPMTTLQEGDCTKRICVLLEACDLYAPQGVDLGEGGSLSYWHDTVKSDWPWLQM